MFASLPEIKSFDSSSGLETSSYIFTIYGTPLRTGWKNWLAGKPRLPYFHHFC